MTIHLRMQRGTAIRPACNEQGAWNQPSTPDLAKVTCGSCKYIGERYDRDGAAKPTKPIDKRATALAITAAAALAFGGRNR